MNTMQYNTCNSLHANCIHANAAVVQLLQSQMQLSVKPVVALIWSTSYYWIELYLYCTTL